MKIHDDGPIVTQQQDLESNRANEHCLWHSDHNEQQSRPAPEPEFKEGREGNEGQQTKRNERTGEANDRE